VGRIYNINARKVEKKRGERGEVMGKL